MFFFFFGGVQPEISKVLESGVAECPRCGSDASLVEYDNVFRAFFIPVWRWAGTNPAVHCDNCSFLLPLEQFQKLHSRRTGPPRLEQRTNDVGPSAPLLRCWSCSSVLQPEFQFCPVWSFSTMIAGLEVMNSIYSYILQKRSGTDSPPTIYLNTVATQEMGWS